MSNNLWSNSSFFLFKNRYNLNYGYVRIWSIDKNEERQSVELSKRN